MPRGESSKRGALFGPVLGHYHSLGAPRVLPEHRKLFHDACSEREGSFERLAYATVALAKDANPSRTVIELRLDELEDHEFWFLLWQTLGVPMMRFGLGVEERPIPTDSFERMAEAVSEPAPDEEILPEEDSEPFPGRIDFASTNLVGLAAERMEYYATLHGAERVQSSPPYYVASSVLPAPHLPSGEMRCGDGLFAIAPFSSGECIGQFLGKLSSTCPVGHSEPGSCISLMYGPTEHIVDPFDEQGNILRCSYAAKINEPSALPDAARLSSDGFVRYPFGPKPETLAARLLALNKADRPFVTVPDSSIVGRWVGVGAGGSYQVNLTGGLQEVAPETVAFRLPLPGRVSSADHAANKVTFDDGSAERLSDTVLTAHARSRPVFASLEHMRLMHAFTDLGADRVSYERLTPKHVDGVIYIVRHPETGEFICRHPDPRQREEHSVRAWTIDDWIMLGANVPSLDVPFRNRELQTCCAANCFWYDFPVPVRPFYSADEDATDTNAVCTYRRSKAQHGTLELSSAEEVAALFSHAFDHKGAHVLGLGKSKLPSAVAVGAFLLMHDGMHRGLSRHGLCRGREGEAVTVEIMLDASWAEKLPDVVYAHRHEPEDVPFPLLYACGPIRPEEELLSLYDGGNAGKQVIGRAGAVYTSGARCPHPCWIERDDGYCVNESELRAAWDSAKYYGDLLANFGPSR